MCKPSIGKIVGIGIFVVIAIIVFPAVTMLLWNWLIPTLFSGPVISYWQALVLSSYLRFYFQVVMEDVINIIDVTAMVPGNHI